MKKFYINSILKYYILLGFILVVNQLYSQTTAIPDTNFEQALIDLGIDKDGVINGSVATADISEITSLNIDNKNISDMAGIEDFSKLERLYCNSNKLTSLDASKNTALIKLFCKNNQLTNINIKNGNNSKMIDGGYNEIIISFDATENPLLDCIQVDHETEIAHVYWRKEKWTAYSENCSQLEYTYIPDTNFEQALIDLNYDRVLDNYIITPVISYIRELDIENKNINDLTGIENFKSLGNFNCQNNEITNIDMSESKDLRSLSCQDNMLTSLDLSQNKILVKLECYNNQIANLDVSENSDLSWLYCYNNQLTNLNVSQNNSLGRLRFQDNKITDFDVSQSVDLYWLECNNNQLSSIDISKNTKLLILDCSDNKLSSLDVSKNTKLDVLFCSNNQLSSIDLSNNLALRALICNNNSLSNLDVNQHTELETLYCNNNNLSSLSLSNNTLLEELECNNNQLNNLDVSNNTNLSVLLSSNNQLESIDVSPLSSLYNLNLNDNQLSSLDISKNSYLSELRIINNQLSNLYTHQNSAGGYLRTLECQSNLLTELDVSYYFQLGVFNATNNLLACISVSYDQQFNIPSNWEKDAETVYATDKCSKTHVPDDNFEQSLIDLGYDKVLDDYIYTSFINRVTNLDVSAKDINELTGIENFSSLQILNCDKNQLTSLDVSQNLDLYALFCSNNQLSNLDVSTATNLHFLICDNNMITTLDVSQNQKLTKLLCFNNQLIELNLKNGNNNNINLSTGNPPFDATGNPSLQCIQVDNVADAESYSYWKKDTTAVYSEDCQSYLGIDDEILSSGLNIYPNPVYNSLTIESQIAVEKVEVYTVLGQKVIEKSSDLSSMSTETLSKGIYMLKILSEKGWTTRRFIKQ